MRCFRTFLISLIAILVSVPSCIMERKSTPVADLPHLEICDSIEPFCISKSDIPVNFYDVVDSARIIFLETSDSCLLGGIDYSRFISSGIVIVDRHLSQGIYLFDKNGAFVRRFGRRGNGLGEYTIVSGWNVNDTSVSISDGMTWKYLKYNIEGKLGSCDVIEDFPTYGVVPFNNGWEAYLYGESNRRDYCIKLNNKFTQETKYAFKVRQPVFQRMIGTSVDSNGNLLFKYAQSDTVFCVSDTLIYPKYTIPIYDYDTDKYLMRLSEMSSKQRLAVENSILNNKCLDGNFYESESWFYMSYRKGKECFALLYDRLSERSYLNVVGIMGPSFRMEWLLPGYPVQLHEDKLVCSIDAQSYSNMTKEAKDRLFALLSKNDKDRLRVRFEDENENPVLCVFNLIH